MTRRRRIRGVLWVSLVLIAALAWAIANFDRLMPALLRLDPEMRAAPHYTDPEAAGPDFLVQGEYAADGSPFAVQVIARGERRFDARLYHGGLPGAGWNGATPITLRGTRAGDVTTLRGRAEARIEGGSMVLTTPDGIRDVLPRVERESPTLGATPPDDAIVLFGHGTNAFDGSVDDAGRLMQGALSRDRFRDFELHVEFRTPFEPHLVDQKRGNSGVYLQKRYEIQVLDSFGLDGAHDECGGLYQQHRPLVNMALPPLAWQTYDIDFRAARFDEAGGKSEPARVTVRHNGVVIHDDVELAGPTGLGAPETPEPGPIFLQDHGNPVRYRNVWLRPKT